MTFAAEWSLDASGRMDAMGCLTDDRDTSVRHYTTSPAMIEASRMPPSLWWPSSRNRQLSPHQREGVGGGSDSSTSPDMAFRRR